MENALTASHAALSDTQVELPAAVMDYCGPYGGILQTEVLSGGTISLTRRVVTASGTSFVVKQSSTAPPDMYESEAAGLEALAHAGLIRTPAVSAAGVEYLLLEHLGGSEPRTAYWEEFGRALAQQHLAHTHSRYGFFQDNYLGLLPQHNAWMDDGHAFFAERRLLRYLSEPRCESALTANDRRTIERVAARLPDLVPAQPASLLHGDLWIGNILVAPDGGPAVADPAVYYGWAEAELSMALLCGGVPDTFFAAYAEVNPLEEGWRERAPLLHLREHLSELAHLGDRRGAAQRLRQAIRPFA